MHLTPKKPGRGGEHPGGEEAARKEGNRGDTSGTVAKRGKMKKETANRKGVSGKPVGKARHKWRTSATPPDGGKVTVRYADPKKKDN